MTLAWLDFEKPIAELEQQIQELRELGESSEALDVAAEIESLETKALALKREIYTNLTRWQRVQLARHPKRPTTLEYIQFLAPDFVELHGDRLYGDDHAIVGGPATFGGRPIMIIGHQRGRDTRENIQRNFGMPNPEGYRKALRLMELAARFELPILTLIDTKGANPGIGAEERGQSEAIARNLREMSRLPVPIVCVVIGEGGSGGALAIAVGDRILMLENAVYSVISPEGCAAILWGDRARAPQAADALRLTAMDLKGLGVIDEIVPEPLGGAHRDPGNASEVLRQGIKAAFAELEGLDNPTRLARRQAKFMAMGEFIPLEVAAQPSPGRDAGAPPR